MRWVISAAVLLSVMVVSAVHASDPVLIRFSHVTGEKTPKGQGALLFKELVEERLAGRVRVEVYPRSRKMNDNQVLLGLLFGDVELAAPSLAKFRAYSKKIQIFDLPFLFDDLDAVGRFQSSEAGQALLESMASRGVKGLTYWDNGMRAMSANRPLRTPADIKGLRFRIEPSRVMEAQYQALGVATVPMPFKQVKEALKLGLVTGQENAWSNIYANNFHDYQRYFTDLQHSYLGYMVVTSTNFWNSLAPDVREELQRILREVTAEVNRIAREKAQSDRQAVIDEGGSKVLSPTQAERAQWMELMKPVWKKFEKQIGKDLIDAAVAANTSN